MARFLTATALLSFLAAAPALASFTLVTPEAAPAQNNIAAAPQASITVAPLAPLAPAPSAPLPVSPAYAPQTMISPAVSIADAPVRGFGKDIPLVIAAQQIAPANREIAFGQGVDPSMPISWKGGKGWRNVLSDALDDRGLQLAEQGNILFISRGNSTTVPTHASLLMQPKSAIQSAPMAAMPPAPVDLTPAPPPVIQSAPVIMAPAPPLLPPVQPAPVMAQPVLPMQPDPLPVINAAPVLPVAQPSVPVVPVYAPPAPVIVTPPQPLLPGQPVIPPQEPVAFQQPPAPSVQSTIVHVPLAPQPIPAIPMSGPSPVITNHAADINPGWNAEAGRTLKQTLEDWSRRANISMRWDSEYDYPIQTSVALDGDYESAVRTLLRGFSSAQPQPVARLYRPTEGAPGVLLVTTRGNDLSTGK